MVLVCFWELEIFNGEEQLVPERERPRGRMTRLSAISLERLDLTKSLKLIDPPRRC